MKHDEMIAEYARKADAEMKSIRKKYARLTAAAPDMLAALKALLDAANQYQDLRDRNGAAVFNAHAAIAKAEGK